MVVFSALSSAERAKLLVSALTFQEKISMLHGIPSPYMGEIPRNNRLDIPGLYMNDGPQVLSLLRLSCVDDDDDDDDDYDY